MQLFRIHILPRRATDHKATFDYCLEHNILGVGSRIESPLRTKKWEVYTEDLVFLWLQSKGWYVLPHSRRGDTMSFEYLAVNRKTEERALTQVKTGDTPIDKNDYHRYTEKIFLFQSNGIYKGEDAPNIVAISKQEILKFMRRSLGWLPGVFQRKVSLCSAVQH